MPHEPELHADAPSSVASVDVAPPRAGRLRRNVRRKSQSAAGSRDSRVRRVFLWLYLVTAIIVALGVLLQAFSIAAYIRGAGQDALDMHSTGGFMTHNVEIVVFLAALVGYWGTWTRVGLALLLPVIGTAQILMIGDTDTTGGWINGLHGLFALVVLLLAVDLAQEGMRSLRRDAEENWSPATPPSSAA